MPVVNAASDHFTLRLAEVMGRAGDLRNPSDIARFSGDESVELLRALLDSLGDRKKELLSEACRTAPVGEFARVATERFGSDAFEA